MDRVETCSKFSLTFGQLLMTQNICINITFIACHIFTQRSIGIFIEVVNNFLSIAKTVESNLLSID